MLDLTAAIFATAYFAAQLGLLIGLSALRSVVKIIAWVAALAWLAVLVATYALGGLPPGVLGPVPVNLLPFALLLALLFGAWFLIPQARAALLSVPLPALMAVHAGRLGGVFFLLLYLDGRLSAPFGPVAGIGDIITGAVALLLTAALLLGLRIRSPWLRAWNGFGALDLVVAVILAVLSAPGTPFRVFTEEPGAQLMGTLPWIFVPAFFVPIDLLVHVAIAAKLKSFPRMPRVEGPLRARSTAMQA